MDHSPIKTALLGGISMLAATAVSAQDSHVIELEPIAIYGDRNAATVDQTQSSVAVIPEDRLGTPTAQMVTDTFRQTVNVTDGDFTESGFVIRGINSEGLTPGGAGAPLASIYIDGVQQTAEAARRGQRGLFDSEQVEIYRGPQSTQSGRNALAGAIYIRTKDPEFGPASGKAQLTYGENNKKQVGLAYGATLTDNLAFRLSGEWSEKDSDLNFPSYEQYPYYDDLATDEYHTIRAKLLWRPTHSEDTEVLFSFARSYDSPDSDLIAGPSRVPGSGVTYADRRGDIWGSLTPPTLGVTPLPIFQDVRDTTVDNFGIEVTHNFDNGITLTALTSLSVSTTDRRSINFGTNEPVFAPGFPPFNPEAWNNVGAFDQRILSQEVRLNYETEGLRWVAGVYAADEKNEGRRDQFFINTTTFSTLENTSTRNEANINNYALFGEVIYEFAPNWNVIAGGRLEYYKQEQTASSSTTDFFTNANTTSASASSHSESEFIPKLGVTYDIDSNNTVALVYQEGYRPGGSGFQFSSGTAYSYDAENAKNLELSWRGALMGGRLRAGASLFYQDWDNQQIEIWETPGDPSSSIIRNAGESKSYGGELELSYLATDSLDIYAAVGLLKTEFEDFSLRGGAVDFSGQAFSNAPEQTVVLGFRWGEEDGWFAGGNVKYVADSLSRIENTSNRSELDSYTTVDAEIGYTWDHGLSISGYATNLFDEEYFTYEASGSTGALGARREVGVRLSKTF